MNKKAVIHSLGQIMFAEAIVLTEDGMHITAFWSRLLCGCGRNGRFEPIFVMENIIPLVDCSFNYRIIEKGEWQWSVYEKAFYNPAVNEIIIRSDVYEVGEGIIDNTKYYFYFLIAFNIMLVFFMDNSC